MTQDRNVAPKDEQRIRKDERKKVRKKKRAKGTIYTAIAALIAYLILSFNGFFGLGPSEDTGNGNGTSIESSVSEDDSTSGVEEEATVAGDDLTIVVSDADYKYMNQTYDLEGIKGVIDGLDIGDQRLDLVDKFATSKAFDELEAYLKEAGIEYNVEEDYKD